MDLVRPVTVSVTRRWWAAWRQKNTLQTVTLVASLAIAFSIFAIIGRRNALFKAMSNQSICIFPAIFNFGDSNSDTGGMSALFERKPYPNGETFFHKPSGRYCDGKVVLDFMGEITNHTILIHHSFSTKPMDLILIYYKFVQLRSWVCHILVHIWIPLGPIFGMEQILQLQAQRFSLQIPSYQQVSVLSPQTNSLCSLSSSKHAPSC